ncbi:MAG: Hsp70 family protein [bacterium]
MIAQMHVGIDLGTTFSCMAYIDDNGVAKVIRNADGDLTTPSIIWFDGRRALVGKKAAQMKQISPAHIYEFVKRDMGKPTEIPPHFFEKDDPNTPIPAPYEIGGFKYGPAGMSAIILRKFKKEAIRFFKSIGKLDRSIDERQIELDAIITVPAYFGDKERQETRLAGYAAGLNVIGVINEPTAAAISYGLQRKEDCRLMVFDLGGGTCDVTLLHMRNGAGDVITSAGDNTLGGKNWDELIQAYIYEQFRKQNGQDIPDDRGYDVQQKAIQSKIELTENEEASIFMSLEQGDLETTLYRTTPEGDSSFDLYELDPDRLFYFNERAATLLSRCRGLCLSALQKSGMKWGHLDDVLLAGGACRMPMVAEMLREASGLKIMQHIDGFSYDTAIAIGATLYGEKSSVVKDVASHSIGVEYVQDRRHYVEHLLLKDASLPITIDKTYRAGPNAELAVYEGESNRPDECVLRGRIELDNPEGDVKIILEADANGMLKVSAEYPPQGRKVMELKNELYIYDQRALPLKEKIQSLTIEL